MADYCIGSTGVAQLHISFAKSEDLVTLDSFAYPTADKYVEFEKRFKRLIGNEKHITSTRKNMVLKEISQVMNIGPRVLESRYLWRFCKQNGIQIMSYKDEKSLRYKQQYQLFSKLRSQYSLIPAYGIKNALTEISKQMDVSFRSLYSENYEFKWRREHETD